MGRFIGAEYLIGNAFIYLTEERFISLKEIHKYRYEVQNYFNEHTADAIISGEIEHAIYNYDDYFKLNRNAGIILLNDDISIDMLREQFVFPLPVDIALCLETVAENLSKWNK